MLDPELSRRYLAAVGVMTWRLRSNDDGDEWAAPRDGADPTPGASQQPPKISGAQAALAAIDAAVGRKPGAEVSQGGHRAQTASRAPVRQGPSSHSATSGQQTPAAGSGAPRPTDDISARGQPLTSPTVGSAAPSPPAPPEPIRPELPPSAPAADLPPPDHPAFATEQPPPDDAAWFGAADGPPLDSGMPPPDLVQPAPAQEDLAAAIARMDWAALESAVADCRRCPLCQTRTRTVFGVGNREAELMLVGEAPGQEEDRRGEPFVGRAGQLLDRMLAAIGLDRNKVFIANVLKCRPPRNRDPEPAEAAACRHYLARQIALIQPRLLLCVGRISAQHLLRTGDSVGRLRRRIHHFGPGRLPLIVTYHPSYYLRTPAAKARGWEDLQRVVRLLNQRQG